MKTLSKEASNLEETVHTYERYKAVLKNIADDKEMINDSLNKISIDNLDELKEIEKNKIRKKLERKYSGEELERKIREKLFQKGFFE